MLKIKYKLDKSIGSVENMRLGRLRVCFVVICDLGILVKNLVFFGVSFLFLKRRDLEDGVFNEEGT